MASPTDADLIFEVRSEAPPSVTGTGENITTSYDPQLRLRILDPGTNAVLWSLTSHIRAAGLQKTRDRQFDEAVVVLIDQVRQLTGEQLTPGQGKAIRSNSRISRQAKILVGVGIAATLAISISGIYLVTHRNTLNTPATHPCAFPPFCPAT